MEKAEQSHIFTSFMVALFIVRLIFIACIKKYDSERDRKGSIVNGRCVLSQFKKNRQMHERTLRYTINNTKRFMNFFYRPSKLSEAC